MIGRPRLDAFIKEYFARFSFQAMDTDTFLAYLRGSLLDAEPGLEEKLQLSAWVDGPGLPDNMPAVASRRFAAVDQVLAQHQAGTTPASLLPATTTWSSHEWVHFLQGLPPTLSARNLQSLDEVWHFTTSGNAEILTAWFSHTVRADYAAAGPALKKFLLHVGRRKFIVPLYRALLATPGGLAQARNIYAEARANYHSVATGTIDEMLAERK